MFYFNFASTLCQTPAYLILFFNWKVEKIGWSWFSFLLRLCYIDLVHIEGLQ